jgi:hypothetical protein
MTWTPDNAPTGELSVQIIPTEVLYYYDGPVIFTANIGLTEFLFYKIDELQSSDLFLLAQTHDSVNKALMQGHLSLRGSITSDNCWILEIDRKFDAKRYWKVSSADLPLDLLPERGFGLETGNTQSADSVAQACSFFSVRFAGEHLQTGQLPFSRFKSLLDNVYDSIRKIFPSPVIEQETLGRVFDFEILPPLFGSLIIAVNKPEIEKKQIKKKIRDSFNQELVTHSLEQNRSTFFDNMGDILDEARKGEIRPGFAMEHFITLDQVNELVPTESNDLEQVEFRGGASIGKPVFVDDKLGSRIRRAHRIAESSERQITGVVVEVNAESGTFIIKDFQHRLTTCISNDEAIERQGVSIHSKVQVKGDFQQRIQRDLLHVRSVRVLD